MGGDTGVESTRGLGSTFWFTARLEIAAAAQALATSNRRINQENTGRCRIQGSGVRSTAAHSLKGASASLHATQSAELASRMEIAARAGREEELAELAERLRAEVDRAIQFLSARVA